VVFGACSELIGVKVSFHWDHHRLVVEAECESGEPKRDQPRMAETSFFVDLPSVEGLHDIHPDHLAMAAFLVFRPWIAQRIEFDLPVSQRFADALSHQRIKAHPVDANLESYLPEGSGYMGLAYSGGADSTAALAVLPLTTVPVFLDRPDRLKSLYRKEAALQSCRQLKQIGYNVHVVACDLESVRDPIGFPTDLANGVPALLLARHLNLNSISYGTVFESLYGLGRTVYKEYGLTSHHRSWWELFEAIGVPLSFPVGGVSEVGTELICSRSSFSSLARSCIRGSMESPCQRCWKCFRKSTVRQALGLEDGNRKALEQMLASKEVRLKLSSIPISHEDVLVHSFSKLNFDDYPDGFRQRLSYHDNLGALERWYSPSLDYVHPSAQEAVKATMARYLEPMSQEDERTVEAWDIRDIITDLEPLVLDDQL